MQIWKQQSPLTKRMYASFGLLSLWTVAGPGLASYSIKTGYKNQWPPENGLEWFGLGLATGGFGILLITTLWMAIKNQKLMQKKGVHVRPRNQTEPS